MLQSSLTQVREPNRSVSTLIVSVVTLLAAVLVAAPTLLPAGEKYALLVGVKEYDNNELRKLPYSEDDVTALAEILRKVGYKRVILLTQTEGAKQSRQLPLAENIRKSVKGLVEDLEADDTVLIAFAGHGVQFQGTDEHYFCPMDAKLKDRRTLVELTEVYRQLEASQAGVKLMLVDACRNDPQSDSSRALSEVRLESVTRPQRRRPPGGVAAFFSCSEGEKAYESTDLKHGIFFHFVLEGLEGKADYDRDGNIDLDELVKFTKKQVPDQVKEEFGDDIRQMPELVGKTRGTMSLIELKSLTYTSKSTCMEFALIPAGEFKMGSLSSEEKRLSDEGPQCLVRITQPFYMGRHEVTQGEFQKVLGRNTSKFSRTGEYSSKVSGKDTTQFPMETVTWYDAIEFCNKLSQSDGLAPRYTLTGISQNEDQSIKSASVSVAQGNGYRLPTEAEWEYACRAGTTTPFHFGSVLNGDQANVDGSYPYGNTTKGPSLGRTAMVGSYPKNAFGLFDMHGNVWEWCEDLYDANLYVSRSGLTIDPLVMSGSEFRVMRGGSWGNSSKGIRSANRLGYSPGVRHYLNGFRVVLSSSTVRTQ